MKLDRRGAAFAALVTLSLMGCGTRVSTKPVACPPTSPTVSTTRLMAAELRDADDRPKVSKSQHSAAPAAVDESVEKDDAHRRGDRRPGGGFSGYK